MLRATESFPSGMAAGATTTSRNSASSSRETSPVTFGEEVVNYIVTTRGTEGTSDDPFMPRSQAKLRRA